MRKPLFLTALSVLLFSQYAISDSATMNGYRFSDYAGFESKWHFVTVRYRKDTGEMRLVYANDLAWKTLKSGKTNYPDGAAFGKVGIATKEDPAFASSAVPSGARRFQLMVKDAKKHGSDDGWGYAIFDEKGATFPGDKATQVKACAACHHIVPDRGYVFSELMPVSLSGKRGAFAVESQDRIKFRVVSSGSLPKAAFSLIPQSVKKVDIVSGDLAKFLFQGTLDEIRPTLAKRAYTTRRPAALVSRDKSHFSLIVPNPKGALCSTGGEMLSYITTGNTADPIRKLSFCYEQ